MTTHKVLLLMLVFHFRNLELVSTKFFKTCRKSYYKKDVHMIMLTQEMILTPVLLHQHARTCVTKTKNVQDIF